MPVDIAIVEPWLPCVAAEVGEVAGGWYMTLRRDLYASECFDVMTLAWSIAAGKIEPQEEWEVRIDEDGSLRRFVEIRLG